MSSLRLALKQSLAESCNLAPQQEKKDRKCPGEYDRRRKRSKLDIKQRLSSKDSRRKLKENKIKLESSGDRRGTGIHVNSGKQSVSSSTLSSSDSDSDSSSDESSNDRSSDSSHSDSSDSQSLHASHDDATSDGGSSSDDSVEHVTMEGVFDSEVSCDDDDDARRKVKKAKKKMSRKRNRLKGRLKRTKGESSTASSNIEKKKSQLHSDSDSRLKLKRRPLSSGSQSASSKNSQSSSNNRQQTVDPPSNQTIVWMRGMSSGKQRRKVAAGLRVKVRFTTKSSKRDEDGKYIKILKWYGGVISGVGSGGKKIRIKYDDGTSEIADFPDKDIVVDSEGNGHHRAPAHAFIPPPMPPTPPRSISPIVSLPSAIVSADKQFSDKSKSDPSQCALLTMSDFSSQDVPPKQEKKYCINVERVQTPVQTSECFPSSSDLPSDLKTSTVSESPMSVNHARCTVTSSTISGSSDSSGSFEHAVSKDQESKITSKSRLIRKRSRSRSPLKPNFIPKLNSNIEEVDSDSSMHDRFNEKSRKGRQSPRTSLKIKLPSMKNKKLFNSVDNERHSTQFELSDSESEFGNSITKGSKKLYSHADPSRCRASISGDEAEVYTRSFNDRKFSEETEEDHEWMGDDEGQGQTYADRLRMHKIAKKQSSAVGQNRNECRPSTDSLARSRKDSDLDSEASLEANTRAKSLGRVIRDLQQSKATAFSKYVKRNSPIPDDVKLKRQNLSTDLSLKSEKKKRRKQKSRSSSPFPSGEKYSSSPKIHSNYPDNKDSCPLQKCSSLITNSGIQNPETIILAMQSEDRDNVINNISKGALSEENRNIGNDDPNTIVSTETVPSDEDSSKLKNSLTSNGGVTDEDGRSSSNEQSRSGRRTAVKTNKKVSTKDDEAESTEKSNSKKSRKGKRKAYRKLRQQNDNGDGGGSDDEDDDGNDENWVQCDHCHKWRLLPSTVNMDTLPERWYCELNHYDTERNNCDAPQQSEHNSPQKVFGGSLVDKFNNKNESRATSVKINTKELITGIQFTSVGSSDSPSSLYSQDGSGNRSISRKSGTSKDENSSNDLTENTDGGLSDNASFMFSSKSSTKRNRGRKEDEREKKSSRGKKKKEAENQEWVQCEKCHKWRKLPPTIAAKDLPEVWYCTMNTWDVRSASCSVAEDEIENNEHERHCTIMGNGKGPLSALNGNGSKLSYRSLIFGSGRRQNRPISERTRAAESLFSCQTTDENNESARPPTCMYSNSSAFYHKGGINRTNPEETNTESFLDIMSHSSLWEDLAQGAQALQSMSLAETTLSADDLFNDLSKDDYIRSMKAMIYYAVGTNTLEGHEILFEAQCREWDDYRWSNLRALCTIEVVTQFLESLIEDGLVEAIHEEDSSGFQIIRYRRTPFDLCNAANHEAVSEPSSRCMKIAKPWKNI